MDFFQTESSFRNGTDSACTACDRLESPKPPQAIPTVFIVDGDEAACESVAALITREGWRSKIFASGEEFLAHPVETTPGCLILDVSLPGLSGLELQGRAALKCPHIPTIFLSAKGDIPTTVKAMKAGAQEFLIKPFRDIQLSSAVRNALERSRLIVAKRAEKQAIQERYGLLTLRQQQVMALVSSGLTNKQVAAELGISEITVKAHRGQLMQRMQAGSLADLVKMAAKLGLIRRREGTMLRDHPARTGYPDGQFMGSYAFVN
jgi:FixJ family two-component response regulator